LNKIPHSRSSPVPLSAPIKRSVAGSNGRRIDFSWTWKENRKKEREEVRSAYGNSASVGQGVPFELDLLPPFVDDIHPPYSRPHTAGANPVAVRIVDSRTRFAGDSHRRHFMITSLEHQKFATLSSKRPRVNGKIRVMGFKMAEGLSHGRKRSNNEATVTKPSLMNSCQLKSRHIHHHAVKFRKARDVPMKRT